MTWHRALNALLRIFWIGAFVPVILYGMLCFPALLVAGGFPPEETSATFSTAVGLPLAGFIILALIAWASLTLWHSDRWKAAGFFTGLLACSAVWSITILATRPV